MQAESDILNLYFLSFLVLKIHLYFFAMYLGFRVISLGLPYVVLLGRPRSPGGNVAAMGRHAGSTILIEASLFY